MLCTNVVWSDLVFLTDVFDQPGLYAYVGLRDFSSCDDRSVADDQIHAILLTMKLMSALPDCHTFAHLKQHSFPETIAGTSTLGAPPSYDTIAAGSRKLNQAT